MMEMLARSGSVRLNDGLGREGLAKQNYCRGNRHQYENEFSK